MVLGLTSDIKVLYLQICSSSYPVAGHLYQSIPLSVCWSTFTQSLSYQTCKSKLNLIDNGLGIIHTYKKYKYKPSYDN